jgi:hypothetical protein
MYIGLKTGQLRKEQFFCVCRGIITSNATGINYSQEAVLRTRVILVSWIRIPIRNTDPDPGGQNDPKK